MEAIRGPEGVQRELLVADDNATDDTDAVISGHEANSVVSMCRLFEARRGDSNARNCEVAAVSDELLIWTDNDNAGI